MTNSLALKDSVHVVVVFMCVLDVATASFAHAELQCSTMFAKRPSGEAVSMDTGHGQ